MSSSLIRCSSFAAACSARSLGLHHRLIVLRNTSTGCAGGFAVVADMVGTRVPGGAASAAVGAGHGENAGVAVIP